MAWFAANWFWVLILIAFIAMHVSGHGCHAGHGGHGGGDHQGSKGGQEKGEAQDRDVNKGSGGHQH